ncbi:MAG: hypothetical protein C6Y22_11915 [Hapalosiphonaceae cyanobacterium JJU2]|nr:MAG: hypothetical protein C6Y22_11915 [Hapalosiphonaceae cyanobacterium JJU2]
MSIVLSDPSSIESTAIALILRLNVVTVRLNVVAVRLNVVAVRLKLFVNNKDPRLFQKVGDL